MSTASAMLRDLSEETVWRLEATCRRFEQAWQAGRRPSLAEFISEAEGPERAALLRELLLLDAYYRRTAGEEPSAGDYRGCLPQDTALVREVLGNDDLGLPNIQCCETIEVPVNGPPAVSSGGVPAVTREAFDTKVNRYRLLRFHAQGGLGEVHVAEDTELDREVALKQMQAEQAADPDSYRRFVLEGEVTGKLEHPGVVPVYGRGVHPDGRPFYTMRFIRGETLGTAIRNLHAQRPVKYDSLEFRQLLGRFVAVCQATAYAHSRGVLHRDLKPANIMLGPFGETLVVDWGLAKVMDRQADAAPTADSRPLAGLAAGATMGAVGTPAYMSPEQAAGRVDELDPTTDVYSLGATLYEMLTGQPPFQGNLFEVLAKVVRGAYPPARQVHGGVPVELDAICRKAMALQPQQRYRSPLELSAEVERWLADEPVAAYREPWTARARRWARKHPSRVTGALVLLVTAVMGLTVGSLVLQRSKREAEDSYQMAKHGVNHFLREVSEDVLMDEPGMHLLRHSLLNEALIYHEGFLKKRPDDPEIQQQLAENFRLRGELDSELGRIGQGIARVERAVGLFEKLLGENRSGDANSQKNYQFGLAGSRLAQADLQIKGGHPEAARETVSRSIDALVELSNEDPGNTIILNLLSRSYDLRAGAEFELGRVDAAVGDNWQALSLLEQVIGKLFNAGMKIQHIGGVDSAYKPDRGFWVPAVTTAQNGRPDKPVSEALRTLGPECWSNYRHLARALNHQGLLLDRTGRKAESVRAFRTAAVLWGWMSDQVPRADRLRNGLAWALLNAGHAEIQLGRPAAAEKDLQSALKILEKLCQENPLIAEYKSGLMLARGYLAEGSFARGQTAVAAGLLGDAVALAADLEANQNSNWLLAAEHSRFLSLLGRLKAEAGDARGGLLCLAKALQRQQQAAAKAPGNLSLRADLLGTRERLGAVGQPNRLREQRQILAEREELAKLDPGSGQLQAEAVASASVLAGLLQEEHPQEALEIIDAAIGVQERLVRADDRRRRDEGKAGKGQPEPRQLRNYAVSSFSSGSLFYLPHLVPGLQTPRVPGSLELRRGWAELLAQKAAVLASTSDNAAAAELLARAVRLNEEIGRDDGRAPDLRCSWPSLWMTLAGERLRQTPEPCHHYDLACCLAQASSLPGSAGIDRAADRAVRLLRALADHGFDNRHKLRSDPRLAPLHDRHDFQELVRPLPAFGQERSNAHSKP